MTTSIIKNHIISEFIIWLYFHYLLSLLVSINVIVWFNFLGRRITVFFPVFVTVSDFDKVFFFSLVFSDFSSVITCLSISCLILSSSMLFIVWNPKKGSVSTKTRWRKKGRHFYPATVEPSHRFPTLPVLFRDEHPSWFLCRKHWRHETGNHSSFPGENGCLYKPPRGKMDQGGHR